MDLVCPLPILYADYQATDPGENSPDPRHLGRSVGLPLYPHQARNRYFSRDDVFHQFALDYAANEDKIRKLYEELEQETQLLHVLNYPHPPHLFY